MPDSLGHTAVKGAVWASIDRFTSMGIQFIVNLVLARLLLPADFGMIGMLAIFITVSQTLIDGGFASALIQKKEPTQVDYSTIFFWNLIFSAFLYGILFFSAPLIAEFYAMPSLSAVLRVMALNLILTGIFAIQKTRLQKQFEFKTLAIVNISAYTLGAIIAILFALYDFGVWSLVVMQLSYGAFSIFLLCCITRWFPSICFSKASLKKLFGFGGYIMAANILQTICLNIQGIIIGKRFSATQMGYYSQAFKLDQVTSYSIPQIIVQVMYPVYSTIQDDKERLNKMVLMNMRVIAFMIFPLLAMLILVAEPLIGGLYGSKWLPAAPYFRIFCVGGFFVCLQNINFYAVAAVGKSKSLFNWSFYKWGFLLASLLIGMEFGMYGIMWGMVLSSANIFFANAYLAQKYTGLSLISQFVNILPVLLIIAVSLAIGFGVNGLFGKPFISALITLSVFLGVAYAFHLQAFDDSKSIISKLIRR